MYKPLDSSREEIRIIHIRRATDLSEPLQCRLTTVSLHDRLAYSALSYVWGDKNDTIPITVNRRVFNATRNLDTALRFLRGKDILVLWADAICINQRDLCEKASQVRLMVNIYRSALYVHAWLGEFTSKWWYQLPEHVRKAGDEYALRADSADGSLDELLISKLPEGTCLFSMDRNEIEQHTFDPTTTDLCAFRLLYVSLPDVLTETSWTQIPFYKVVRNKDGTPVLVIDSKWRSALDVYNWLMSRPWWTRVWTLQEAVVCDCPPILHVGDHEVEFKTLYQICRALMKFKRSMRGINAHYVGNILTYGVMDHDWFCYEASLRLLASGPAKTNNADALWQGIAVITRRKATDRRDCYYGILGLFGSLPVSEVNYSVTFEKLCCQVTRAEMLLRPQGTDEWLRHAVGISQSGHPTWAIDFCFRCNFDVHHFNSNAAIEAFVTRKLSDDLLLGICASRVCKIDFAGEPYFAQTSKDPVSIIQELLHACEKHGIECDFPRGLRTLLGDDSSNMCLGDPGLDTQFDGSEQLTDDAIRRIGQLLSGMVTESASLDEEPGKCYETSGDLSIPSQSVLEKWSNVSTAILLGMTGWSLFASKDAGLGKGRNDVKPNDEIFVIKGCGLPVVLRRVGGRFEEGAPVYNLVGECYLDGWMDARTCHTGLTWEEIVLA